jgi:transcriptional regulator with XRE-family HTH domain
MKYILNGKVIKNLRNQKGWNQGRLAEEVGFEGPTSIGRIENGSRPVSEEMLVKLAKALDTDSDALIKEEYDDSPISQRGYSNTHVESVSYQEIYKKLSAMDQRISGLELLAEEKPITLSGDELTQEEIDLIKRFRASSDQQRKAALAAANAILSENL